ncbi:MAG: RNA 3'-phosphate cyclase [Candidatus Lokiarchaeota archaeon]|nr:RNA 3'-phosphate cyclase [Candidatus Lokiarchaeota archaeon]
MTVKNILEIDGSFGEGGGSIIRLSAGYSVLFNQPIKIFNIRANRSKPGLRLQHLLGLRTLAEITNSKLSDCDVGTKEIIFKPNNENIKSNIDIKITTAASIGLLLQPIQIACLGFNQPKSLEIYLNGGGTLGKWAPGLDYLKHVTYQIIEKSNFKIDLDIKKYGFYPKGGARTICKIFPAQKELKPIILTELGNIDKIEGKIICSEKLNSAKVSERIKQSVEKKIKQNLNINMDIKFEYVNSLSTGVGLSLWAKSDIGAIISSGTVLGEKNLSSEQVGNIAAHKLLNYIHNKIPVDNFLSDQLLPLMGYIKSPSKIKVLELTNHTKTNLELIRRFTKRDYLTKKTENYITIEFL